jgi:hypothetical protein
MRQFSTMRQVSSSGGFSDAFRVRVTCYRERAQQFRDMAEAEQNDRVREYLFDMASRYDLIAENLGGKGSRFF